MRIDTDNRTVRMSWGEYLRERAANRVRRRISGAGWVWLRFRRAGRQPAIWFRALVRPDLCDPLDRDRPCECGHPLYGHVFGQGCEYCGCGAYRAGSRFAARS